MHAKPNCREIINIQRHALAMGLAIKPTHGKLKLSSHPNVLKPTANLLIKKTDFQMLLFVAGITKIKKCTEISQMYFRDKNSKVFFMSLTTFYWHQSH